jgi:hypothetical protein
MDILDKKITLTGRDLQGLLRAAVLSGVEESGVRSGFVSTNEARRRFGDLFTIGAASGEIQPIHVGRSKHAQKRWRIGDITAYIETQRAATNAMLSDLAEN